MDKLSGRTLVVIDRLNAKEEKMPADGGRAWNEIERGADFNDMSMDDAADLLLSGQELTTFGYLRRLE